MKLLARDAVVPLDRVATMGVVNVTPDSFSDGGLWFDAERAAARGLELVRAGAALVDVGGESTRPGAEPVPEDEELRRVLPVVTALAEAGVAVSIDTRKPEVARCAIDAGAVVVNDTGGEGAGPDMAEIAASTGSAIVMMHSRGTPATMRAMAVYDDVVAEVASWLGRAADALVAAGVAHESIVLDPGIGFAKTSEQSLELLRRLDEIVELGFPVLVGTSRKSFIGAVLEVDVTERGEGTAATVAWAVSRGARLVRVHDVAQMTQVVRMTEAIMGAR